MKILAFQSGYHDASAATLEDFELRAAVSQERLSRKKGDGGDVPLAAIDEVLSIAGWGRDQVDVVVCGRGLFPYTLFSELPILKSMQYGLQSFGKAPRTVNLESRLIHAGATHAERLIDLDKLRALLGVRPTTRVFFFNHHFAHALSALFHLPEDDVLIYTGDGRGDGIYYSHYHLKNGQLTTLYGGDDELLKPTPIDSLGQAYAAMTKALGYKPNRHEGKLTGLAAYGKPTLLPALAARFSVDEAGRIRSDFTGYKEMWQFIAGLAASVTPEEAAASIQKLLEQTVLESVRRLLSRTGARRLALAGGIFSNVRLNQVLVEETGVEEIFIFPAMADDGLAVGGAYQFLLEQYGLPAWLAKRRRIGSMYLGRNHDDCADPVLAGGEGVHVSPGDSAAKAARLCAAGLAGAVYVDRMEFGPRALGARSIVASPANAGINASLNERLQRTEFMPFAPYVLAADARDVFHIDERNAYACKFMTITVGVRPEWRQRIPAVVHVDGTARPQIITDDDNPLYAAILRHFRDLTGLKAMVNTSFNAHEEPIINTPEECLRALTSNRIDFVVTPNAVYSLKPIDELA